MAIGDCNYGVGFECTGCTLCTVQSLGWVYVHYIVFLHFCLFTYVQLQHGHVVRNPKKESHMAYALYSKYSNYLNYLNYLSYSKLAAGKFRHFFHGQLFFRWPMSGPQPDATKDVFLLTSLDGFYPILIMLNCESLHFLPYVTGADIMLKYIPAAQQFSCVRESCSFRF